MNQSPRQPERVEPDKVEYFVRWDPKDELLLMNRRFVAAMAAAIRARLERPPRVGIDRTPGTKKPLLYRSTRR
jgi:hypothetical protein